MLLLILSLGACSEEKEGELCFVGDSLVAGWDVKDAFPTWIVRNDGVSGAKLEDIATSVSYTHLTLPTIRLV